MTEIHITQMGTRKLESMSPNELRALCWKRGITITKDIRTKAQLIKLIKEQ